MAPQKHQIDSKQPLKHKKRKTKPVAEGSVEDIRLDEVDSLIRAHGARAQEPPDSSDVAPPSFARFAELEVDILELGSLGDGLGLVQNGTHVIVVPFTVPGDKALARIYCTTSTYSLADLVKIVKPSAQRDDSLVNCRYFGKCSGCQLQMMSYKDQLDFKRNIIFRAFQRYFGSSSALIPEVDPTHPSPLVFGYRTKITPHFEIPRSRSKEAEGQYPREIGFVEKGRSRIIDIEECAIATAPLNAALLEQRALAKQKLYKRGATILLREALSASAGATPEAVPKRCVTDPNEIIIEDVNGFRFEFPAGSFFQNNNVILGDFTGYVRDQIAKAFQELDPEGTSRFLVDAYCGSGLFSVTCSQGFDSVTGVEISADSVKYAIQNATANNITNASFITGSADRIFEVVKTPPDHTALIIDPPRKGCDVPFLDQLVQFNPRVVIYVSCNVHTQARDIGFLLNERQTKYRVSAIRGFDLFPQTHHVESIVTLLRY